VRNGLPHLEEAAASLSAQTLTDFEVIAVDDGSSDGTREALAEWSSADPRVRVLEQAAAGIVPALERARGRARGRFLARMDADDRAEPGRLAAQLALMEARPEVALCGAHVRYFPPEVVRDGARRYEAWLNDLDSPEALEEDLFVECPLAHPTFFMRAAAVERAGGYVDRGWPEDYDLLLRLWEAGGRLDVVPQVLHAWREGPGRHSRIHPAYSLDAFRRCKVHYLARTRLRGRESVVIWGAGPTGKAFGRALQAAGYRVDAWVDVDDRKIGQEIHGAPVVGPELVTRYRGLPMIAAVAGTAHRNEVRKALWEAGFREPTEIIAVA